VLPYSFIAWSPDGQRLAFQTLRAGRSQVWTTSVADGTVQRFEQTSSSTIYGHLAWAPGARIAYMRPDIHNIHLIDPASAREIVIAGDTGIHLWSADSPGRLTADFERSYLQSPQYSPDGNRLAVLWGHTWTFAMWAVDLRDSTYRKITDRPLFARGWSNDARYLYGQYPTGGSTIYRIDVRGGGVEPIAVLPFREAQCSPIRSRNAFLCVAFDFTSDAWMIENFDGSVR
jgi:Tol biopolymer transport system component